MLRIAPCLLFAAPLALAAPATTVPAVAQGRVPGLPRPLTMRQKSDPAVPLSSTWVVDAPFVGMRRARED